MNKLSKSLLVLFLAFLLGSCFSIFSAQAQDGELILGAIKECDFQYSGDICIAELKLTNNTGKVLDGEASLHIDYKGMCSNNELKNFDGEGIHAWYNDSSSDSDWNNGEITFSGFEIAKGETQLKLKIETVPNLCPGEYTFTLSVEGTFEEEEYTTPPIAIGGGGGGGGGGDPARYCGDTLIHANLGEECDDGNTINGDGCSSVCKIERGEVAGVSTEQQGGEEEQGGGGEQGSGTGKIAEATTGASAQTGTEVATEKINNEQANNEQTGNENQNLTGEVAGEETETGSHFPWWLVILALLFIIILSLIFRKKKDTPKV